MLGGFAVGVTYYITIIICVPETLLATGPPQWPVIIICTASGLLGSTVDSILGATCQFSGKFATISHPQCMKADIYTEVAYPLLSQFYYGSTRIRGQGSSVGKKPDLKSIDRRFEPHCRRGVFLVWVYSKPLTSNCSRVFGSPR